MFYTCAKVRLRVAITKKSFERESLQIKLAPAQLEKLFGS